MGEDALSEILASTSQWDAGDYARVGSFVPELGQAALDLLDPHPGERILDVGCGDGALSVKIIDRAGLEARVCECYAVVKEEYDRLLGDKGKPADGRGGTRDL